MPPLEYAEYNDIVDMLEKSDAENTYQELMKKEDKVLDTVNKVIRHYNDNEIKESQFVNLSLAFVFRQMFVELPMMISELQSVKKPEDIYETIKKNNRMFYIGMFLVILSMFLVFVSVTK